MTDTEKQEIGPSLHKSSQRGWLPCHWEMGVRWSKNTIRSAKTGNKNSSTSNVLWFRIVQNKDKTQKNEVTVALRYENTHVPISMSSGDTLEREPTHIRELNSNLLIQTFMEELERLGKNITSPFLGQSRVQARIYWPAKEKEALADSGMVRPGACSQFQLQPLWLESDQSAFRRVITRPKVKLGKKREHNKVHEEKRFPLHWNYQLSGPRQYLRKVGKSQPMLCCEIVVPLLVVR